MEFTQTGAERFAPDFSQGLSDAQVAQRVRQGLNNETEELHTKSNGQIIRDNTLTPFNLLNFALAALILSVGSYKNLLFMGVIVCNTLIGIFQELKAKHIIDKLSLITAPKAHIVRGGMISDVPVNELVLDDVLLLSAGQQVPADCTVLDGDCEADESLLTGESDAIAKKTGDSLLSGSFLVSGSCRAQVEHVGKDNYAAKITASAKYIKKPNSEIMHWTNFMIRFISIMIIPVGILLFYKQYVLSAKSMAPAIVATVAALIGMIPEGLVLLTSVVFAVGVIRLSRHRALVQELYSIETLARVDMLCLDKTGTLTEGSMQVDSVVPLGGTAQQQAESILAALSAALADHTPTMEAVGQAYSSAPGWKCVQKVSFSSARKWSYAAFEGQGGFVIGAGEFILKERFEEIRRQAEEASARGQRVLLLGRCGKADAEGLDPASVEPLALVLLSDKIRKSAKKTLSYFADEGVHIKVISGDNPVTVASIAKKAGLAGADSFVDASTLENPAALRDAAEKYTVFGRVTPRQKLDLVKALKEKKHTVAMTGDGVNDVPALKESDCSIAMASGSDAARTVSQFVLLDSDFSRMPLIVKEGRRSINNLQRSASLFIVKAVFSAIIAVVFIFLNFQYPFQPIQFTLINAVSIGFPSFFLALEPNHERLRGKFIVNVMQKSLPGALAMALNVILVSLISPFFGFTEGEISTLAVILTGYTALLILFKVCMPFSTGHVIMFFLMASGFILALIFFPALFEISAITLQMVFALVMMMFLATSLLPALYHLIEKVILKQ